MATDDQLTDLEPASPIPLPASLPISQTSIIAQFDQEPRTPLSDPSPTPTLLATYPPPPPPPPHPPQTPPPPPPPPPPNKPISPPPPLLPTTGPPPPLPHAPNPPPPPNLSLTSPSLRP